MKCLKYIDSFGLTPDQSFIEVKGFFKVARETNSFISIGSPTDGDEIAGEKPNANTLYFNMGTISRKDSENGKTYDLSHWLIAFDLQHKRITKPFWFQGKRFTVEEFKGVLLLIA